MLKTLVAFALLAAVAPGPARAATWYVDDSVAQSGDGTSWEAAFKTVQESQEVVGPGDTIIVAPGTYYLREQPPGASLEPDLDMGARGGLLGGPPVASPGFTLRSTDPSDPDVVASTILHGGGIFIWAGYDETMVISGFTIRDGNTTGHGGAIHSNWNEHSHATIENNIICCNSAAEGDVAIAYCDGIIRNNIIKGNWAEDYYGSSGGALYDCDGLIEGNIIAGNWATFTEWTVMSAAHGGALFGCDGTIRNNVISGNWAWTWGGGLYGCQGIIENNTICGNEAENAAGLSDCQGIIRNDIVWGNQAEPYGEPDFSWSSQPTYCAIHNWTGGGEGNISLDPSLLNPRFVDEANGDYRLLPDSPCRNAGNTVAVLEVTLSLAGNGALISWFGGEDLDGNPRISGAAVDIGAYEYQEAPSSPAFMLEYSSDLMSWQSIDVGSVWQWLDEMPDGLGSRFYRIGMR